MNERDTLLWNVLANPACDTARLVFADWLQENGEEERAEFIRWQMRNLCIHPYPQVHWRKWFNPWWRGKVGSLEHLMYHPHQPEAERYYCGERRWALRFAGGNPIGVLEVARGFVHRIEIHAEALLSHAAEIFAAHPVAYVSLMGKTPTWDYEARDYGWYKRRPGSSLSGEDGELPAEIWDLLEGAEAEEDRQVGAGLWKDYPDREGAVAALSAACVAHGRKLAKLPALPEPAPV